MSDKEVIINIPSVDTWTLKDLRYACKKNKIKNYTKMSREELVSAVTKLIENLKGKGDTK